MSRYFFLILIVTGLLAVPQVTSAQPTGGRPADFRSRNFLIHTDLPAAEAQALLKEMETMLSLISKYWGRPNRKIIECYVVDDLKNWNPRMFPDPQGYAKIAEGAGVTPYVVQFRGGRPIDSKATVYAVAKEGVPKHEAVHAYCALAFGRTGPVWYAEGMAEMGQYWQAGDSSVNASPYVIDYLKKAEPKSLNEIVNGKEVTGDSWQNYAWRWALCHLLANNTNYSERFRPLGLALLTNRPNVSFESIYGSMAQEIIFEYVFFLEHMKPGYRVDLCSWDWKSKFRRPRVGSNPSVKINAKNGWQASRAQVQEGDQFVFSADGSVTLEPKGKDITAEGDASGAGKLEGVVLDKEYKLSEVIEITPGEKVRIPADGKLFLRIVDDWGSLGDNLGSYNVKCLLESTGS